MSEEDKMFFEKFILNNPFDFKQGIINHCRTMDKLDVYEWVAEDELKINNLTKENQELKKQLEEFKEMHKTMARYALDNEAKIDELENQQKEFIEYLEYQVKLQEELNDKHLATGFEEILSKYKEIIGVSNENNT